MLQPCTHGVTGHTHGATVGCSPGYLPSPSISHVSPQTWGSLPAASQDTWTKLGCDRAALTPAPTPRRPAASVKRPAAGGGDGGDGGDGSDGGAGGGAGRRCSEMREAHHVLPGTSWGTLSERQKRLWDKLDCNTIDPELMRQKVPSKK